MNQIADILHTTIFLNYGYPNKNLGDTFLFLWKIQEIDKNFEGDPDSVLVNESHVTELAIYGILKSIAKIHAYMHIRKYNQEPKILEKCPEFKTELLFGLHQGRAYEGAVGSLWKIDANYVSPDVTVASRLSLSCEYYGVNFIFSKNIFWSLTDSFKAMCWEIDWVKIKGVKNPVELYTITIEPENMKGEVYGYQNMNLHTHKDKLVERLKNILKEK